MTHLAYPTSPARPRRAAPDRGALRRWVTRHLVALDPTPSPSTLDALDAHRQRVPEPDVRRSVGRLG